MGNKIDNQNMPTIPIDEELNHLADNITNLVIETKTHLAKTINTSLVVTYWNIGKYIVEFEQQGNTKAKYGTALLTSLARILRIKLGKGYSRPNLNNMRKFYLLYPICQTLSDKLSWSHICELITIDDELERRFYEKECIAEKWNVRSLRRQMDSALETVTKMKLNCCLQKELINCAGFLKEGIIPLFYCNNCIFAPLV